MNVDTGHLIDTSGMIKKELDRLKNRNYKPVPEELQPETEKELDDKKEVMVDLKDKTPLSTFSLEERRKMRRKMRKKLKKRKNK